MRKSEVSNGNEARGQAKPIEGGGGSAASDRPEPNNHGRRWL